MWALTVALKFSSWPVLDSFLSIPPGVKCPVELNFQPYRGIKIPKNDKEVEKHSTSLREIKAIT